jgi:hypothetical protein
MGGNAEAGALQTSGMLCGCRSGFPDDLNRLHFLDLDTQRKAGLSIAARAPRSFLHCGSMLDIAELQRHLYAGHCRDR